ncbi:hypothetical protein SAMN05216548_106172 [Faunimonas pinastri]|uniref:MARVEL domain-containing protein n=1 Tax=Faunimonas pinastri TaxID=1855383 RepID=A0A1H9HUW6_9HYPH|nr:hypothetical protein [Faunimonas pinastri]SEQ66149.1 hypothetical protein SAMN05216548_106172 [Faunimonas pinastri]
MRNIPFLIIPFVIYDVFAFLILSSGAEFGQSTVFSVPMVSGASFTLTIGALLVVLALVFLFVEIVKSTRLGAATIVDQILSMLVFLAYVVEFLLVPAAATGTFLILTIIALLDVCCGVAVSLRSATRDVSVSHHSF